MSLLGAALFGGGATLLNGVSNFFGTKSANDTNIKLQKEANQANLELYKQQFADTYKLWQENNAYNEPSMQMQRLRAAGLNPSLSMGNNPTGLAQAASVPSSNPMAAARVEPYNFNFSDIGVNIANIAQGVKSSAEAQGVQMNNQYINQEKIVGIANTVAQINERLSNVRKGSAEASYLRAQKDWLMQEYKFASETFDTRKQSLELDNQVKQSQMNVLKEQAINFAADSAYKKSLSALNWVEHSYRGQLLKGTIDNLINQAVLSKSTAHFYDAQSLTETFKQRGLDISNSQASEMLPYIKDQAQRAIKQADIDIMQSERDYSNPFNYFGRLLGGTGSAGIKTFFAK